MDCCEIMPSKVRLENFLGLNVEITQLWEEKSLMPCTTFLLPELEGCTRFARVKVDVL